MDFDRYNFEEYLAKFVENPSQDNIDNLAWWLERYSPEAWNGEHLRIGDSDNDGFLVPVYVENMDGELEHTGHWSQEY